MGALVDTLFTGRWVQNLVCSTATWHYKSTKSYSRKSLVLLGTRTGLYRQYISGSKTVTLRASTSAEVPKDSKTNEVLVVDGSLGIGNIGDEELLTSFRESYSYRYTICTPHEWDSGCEDYVLPCFHAGWRRFRGWQSQIRGKARIKRLRVRARAFVSLGGLLGWPVHVDLRHQVSSWAWKNGWPLAYYFGDVEPMCRQSSSLQRMCQLWERSGAWISVRSTEAASLLREAGFVGQIHCGVDIVTYRRLRKEGYNFTRRSPSQQHVALCPCNAALQSEAAVRWWSEAAETLRENGLGVYWCILAPEDLLAVRRVHSFSTRRKRHTDHWKVRYGTEAIEKLSSAHLCVTGRFHGLVFAATAGVPTLVDAWNGKLSRLNEMLSLSQWSMCLARDDVKDISHWLSDQPWDPQLEKMETSLQRHAEALSSFDSWLSGCK